MTKQLAKPKSISVYPIDEQIIRETRRARMLSTDSEAVQWALRRLVREGLIELAEGGDNAKEPAL